MGFKYLGLLGLIGFVSYLAKVRKPSLYGWIFIMLCAYLPISGKYPFNLGPGVNLINIFFLALFLTGRSISLRQDVRDPVQKMGVMWICVLVLAFFISILHTGINNIENLLVSLKRLLDPLIIYYFAKRLVYENDQKATLDGIIFGVIFFSGHLFLQGLDIGDKMRVGGFLGQANAAAAFIAAYAPLLLSSLSATRKKISSLILMAGLVLCVIAEVQTVSRGGIIGLGSGLLFVAIQSRKKIIKAAVLILAILVIASPALLPDRLMSRFEGKSISNNQEDTEAAISMSARTEVWSAAFSMILSNPFGVGMDRFTREIVNYGGPRLDAHNILLRVWGEMGTQGVLVFIALISRILIMGWKMTRKENEFEKFLGTGLVGGMLSLCITNMTSTTMLNSLIVSNMIVLAAISFQVFRCKPLS